MFSQRALTQAVIEIPVVQRKMQIMKAVFPDHRCNSAHKKASCQMISATKGQKIDLIQKFLWFVNFCKKTVTGCDICNSTAKMILRWYNGHQIIVFGFIQWHGIQCGSRCEQYGSLHALQDPWLSDLLPVHRWQLYWPFSIRRWYKFPQHETESRTSALSPQIPPVLSGQCDLQFLGCQSAHHQKHFKIPRR